jgi:hypothetical protein
MEKDTKYWVLISNRNKPGQSKTVSGPFKTRCEAQAAADKRNVPEPKFVWVGKYVNGKLTD